jgi:1-acyl-sn-glycerol-3-phosphate acyltransferase
MPEFVSTVSATPAAAQNHRLARAFRWTRLITHICVGLALAGALFPRISERRRARITRWWSRKTLRILNIVLSVCGERPPEAACNLMIASNHVSWLDIYVINAAHPSRFVAKAEIREWPIVGWLCEKAGTIFIRRSKRSDTMRINDEIHNVLATGATIGFFPEGTTTAGDRLHKFHTSLFEPAVVNRAALIPAAIRYLTSEGERASAAAYIDDLSFAESLSRIISQKSMIAEITFAPRIDAGALPRRELALKTESAIAAILNVPIPTTHRRFAEVSPDPMQD